MIRLTTNFGTIDIELDYKNAPVTASNFEQYVKDGHYNGLIFHRVIPGFMIQGGGFKPGMDEVGTREPIKNEANNGLSNEKYTIAMGRAPTGSKGFMDDVPVRPVIIESVKVLK